MRNGALPIKLLLLVLISLVLCACSEQPSGLQETEKAFHVAKGEQLVIVLQKELSSNTNKIGDSFQSRLKVPLKHNDVVVLPQNSIIKSSVTDVKKYEKFGDKARLGLSFDQLELSSGREFKLVAFLDQSKGKSPIKVKGKAQGDAKAVIGTAVMGALMEDTASPSTTQTMSDTGLLLGAMIGTGSVLLSKAKEVSLPVGTEMTITLGLELIIPKSE